MDFSGIAQNFGFAAFCLIGLALGVGWSIRWIGKYIVLPLVTRHIAFLDFLEHRITEQAQMHSDNVKRMNEIHEAVVNGK